MSNVYTTVPATNQEPPPPRVVTQALLPRVSSLKRKYTSNTLQLRPVSADFSTVGNRIAQHCTYPTQRNDVSRLPFVDVPIKVLVSYCHSQVFIAFGNKEHELQDKAGVISVSTRVNMQQK